MRYYGSLRRRPVLGGYHILFLMKRAFISLFWNNVQKIMYKEKRPVYEQDV